MKIWGVAASRSREAPRPADVPADVPPPPEPVGQRRPGVSHAGLRVLARLRREAPVDLRLDSQELRSVADIRAVVEACGAQPPKTLTLGPWGHEPSCSCHGGFGSGTPAVLPAESCESADAAIQAFLGCARIWGAWPLRSISLCELRGLGSEAAALGAQLARLRPPTLRLQHLGMRGSALATCLEALRGLRLELLDLSGNTLEDEDLAMLLRLMSGSEPLQLSGLTLSNNPAISQTALRPLLAATQLSQLDLAECSIGPSGAMLLEEILPHCQLRDLSLYRSGIGLDGLRRVAEAACKSGTLRALDVTANGQHCERWVEALGKPLAFALASAKSLKVLTLSCPEQQLQAATGIFQDLPVRVILVPNEQNNYNRPMFLGHSD